MSDIHECCWHDTSDFPFAGPPREVECCVCGLVKPQHPNGICFAPLIACQTAPGFIADREERRRAWLSLQSSTPVPREIS